MSKKPQLVRFSTHTPEFVIPGRRSFLAGGASVLVQPLRRASFSLLSVLLADCGGSGGGAPVIESTTIGTGTTSTAPPLVTLTALSTTGTIVLPAGAPVALATVASLFSQSTPAADGSFTVTAVKEAPLVVAAYTAANQPVLMGFAQDGTVVLSAKSTAVVLAYLALGVGAYVPQVQLAYVSAIQNASGLAALESAVTAAIVADGALWLNPANATLANALVAVQHELSPAALAAAVSATSAASTDSAGVRSAEVHDAVVDRNGIVSGLQMLATATGTLTIENYYRRRSYVYVNKVAYTLPGSADEIASPAAIGTQPITISPTDGLGNFIANLGTALGYASTGQVPTFYDPNLSDPISIPLSPDNASSTTYTVTAVGLGVHAGDFAQLTAPQRTGWMNVCLLSLVCDLIGPAVASVVLPGMAESLSDALSAYAIAFNGIADITSAIGAVPGLQDDLAAGNMTALFFDGINAITTTNSIPKLIEIILNFGQQVGLKGAVSGTTGAPPKPAVPSELINTVMGYFGHLNAALTAVDTVVQGLQLANCNLADVFTITQTPAHILLVPSTKMFVYPNTAPIPFTVSINDPDIPNNAVLTYNWGCSCQFGEIGSGGHASGLGTATSFDSTQAVCSYAPANSQALGGDTDSLTVKVFLGAGSSANLPALAQTSTVITYYAPITPSGMQISPGAQQQLTAGISANLNNPQPFQYVWTCTGGNGAFPSGATQTTTDPSILYIASQSADGTDTINLMVTDANGTLVTKGTTTISTEPQLVATITPASPTQLNPGQMQSFSVTVTTKSGAALPAGLTYQWSVSGLGTLTPPTTMESVGYTAPSVSTTDTLTVSVNASDGTALARATESIMVGNPWVGMWVGSTVSTCGSYSGPQNFNITVVNATTLDFGPYLATYSGNTASVNNGEVVFTLSGNTITGYEADSCQHGTYTRQGS